MDEVATSVKSGRMRAAFSHAHTPSKSVALMRRSVKKPNPTLKRQLRVSSATDNLLERSIVRNQRRQMVNKRGRVLDKYQKSPHIDHFAKTAGSTFTSSATTADQHNRGQLRQIATIRETVNQHQHVTPTLDIFERAIERASVIEQPPLKLPRKKRRQIAVRWTATAVLVLILAVGLSHNMTSFKLQMASAKAGFTPSVPKVMPSGYSLSQLAYTQGDIGLSFRNPSNGATYNIIQKASNWNDSALRTSFLNPSFPEYQTEYADGLKVYFFGNHNATWVDNGIWYTIESNGVLSVNQLLQMATST